MGLEPRQVHMSGQRKPEQNGISLFKKNVLTMIGIQPVQKNRYAKFIHLAIFNLQKKFTLVIKLI